MLKLSNNLDASFRWHDMSPYPEFALIGKFYMPYEGKEIEELRIQLQNELKISDNQEDNYHQLFRDIELHDSRKQEDIDRVNARNNYRQNRVTTRQQEDKARVEQRAQNHANKITTRVAKDSAREQDQKNYYQDRLKKHRDEDTKRQQDEQSYHDTVTNTRQAEDKARQEARLAYNKPREQ